MTNATMMKTTAAENVPKPPRRWRKRLLYTCATLAFLAFGVVAVGKLAFDRIEADAMRISETGVSLNTFLKTYVDCLARHDVDAVVALYADEYRNEREGLWRERLQSDRDGVEVLIWSIEEPQLFRRGDVSRQIEEHLSRIGSIDDAKFKISSIEEVGVDGSATIRAVLWIRGRAPDDRVLESRTEFRLRLQRGEDWRIDSQELLHGQTVLGSGTGFSDITSSAGIAYEAHKNEMLNDPQWFPGMFEIMRYAGGGVAAADYDGDGWVDVFFADGVSSRLYRNQRDGTFVDVTQQAGLPLDLNAVHVALLVDLDNDGDKDLFLGRSTGDNFLFRNDGSGTFTDVSETANVQGVWVATAAAADYDNDGLIDLYLGRYLDPRVDLPTTNFYTRNGQGNSLLRNRGDLTFTDVTLEAGVREGGLTLGLAWADYDNDGDQDIYVANDFGRNALFRNNGNGTFTDVAKESGTASIGYGMSSGFADIDNDGDLDIYTAGVHSGQRWFGNPATIYRYLLNSIQEGTIYEDYPLYREIKEFGGADWQSFGEQVINGNALMLNNGNGAFTDVSNQAGVNPQGWYWSSAMFDFDNDGLQDIYTVNGWITGKTKDDL